MLSNELIKQYQVLHKEKYGENISDEKALEEALMLVNFVETGGLLVNKYKNTYERKKEYKTQKGSLD